jgi:hypothetical protein
MVITTLHRKAGTVLFTIAPLLAGCSEPPSSETLGQAGDELVSDIATMMQNPDGTFEVTCKNGRVEHAVPSHAIRDDRVCNRDKPEVDCFLQFLHRQPGTDTVRLEVQRFALPFDGYPNFDTVLGGPTSTPYWVRAEGYPGGDAASSTNGIFQLFVHNAEGLISQSGNAVSIVGLGPHGGVMAAYVWTVVPPFDYRGSTYNVVLTDCRLLPPSSVH